MPIAMEGRHVWHNVRDVVFDDVHEQFVVRPHSPDRLGRPSPSAGALHGETLESLRQPCGFASTRAYRVRDS